MYYKSKKGKQFTLYLKSTLNTLNILKNIVQIL